MKSIQQQWFQGTLLLCLCSTSLSFQPQSFSGKRSAASLRAVVDPSEIASAASSLQHHPELPTLLSTMISTTVQEAHGHSNPLFGPPDPILAAKHSIAPSAKALSNMGITKATTVKELIPDSSEEFQQSVTAAAKQGWKLLNFKDITVERGSTLPGFTKTAHILPTRGPEEDIGSWAAELKWATGYFNVMDKLPFVAFWYAMVEFFILRPNVDLYKEDIDADPMGVTADTISVAAVRFTAIAILAVITVVFFG